MIRGEPGIGKSALLDEATRQLPELTVIRADGYEAETAMPYSALQRLSAPLAHHLASVPPRQADALRVAAGLDAGPAPDAYLVALGVLSLLAAAGNETPIACVVDDAHLVDAESLLVLGFVGRRLSADAVALLLAARPDRRVDAAMTGLSSLDLVGLNAHAAVRLLNTSASTTLDPFLATKVAEETGGNPLALIDLAREFSTHELVDAWTAEGPIPIGVRLETHYLSSIQKLPRDAQLWLLAAAAESTGDRALIEAASNTLGLSISAPVAAEQAGFASIRRHVQFRHPLVRAAVYNGLPAADRLRVHAALRDAATARGRTDLAVWHAAAATLDTDDGVASELETAADAAAARGGSSSRARLLIQAAELTPTGAGRDHRLIAAAEAAADAGMAQLGLELLDRLVPADLDPVSTGRVLVLRTSLALFLANTEGLTNGTKALLRAAELFHGRSADLEQRTLLFAFQVDLSTEGAVRAGTLPELGRRLAAGAAVADGLRALLLDGLAAHMQLPYSEAVPKMRAAVDALDRCSDAELLEHSTNAVALTMALWDEGACADLLERTVRVAREAGALRVLDTTLWLLSLTELVRGGPGTSGRYVEQVRELRRAMGYDAEQVVNGSYLAWSGAPTELVEAIADGTLQAGWAGVWTITVTGLCVRAIADGRYREAFERLQPLVQRNFLQVTYQQMPDFVEAGARSGNADAVRPTADRLAMFAAETGTPWIRGLANRCAALLADDAEAELLYVRSIDDLNKATAPGELGRSHLLYGEWLRRVKRRRDAREQLRLALDIFVRVEAPAFAARARRELEATGDHVAAVDGGDALSMLTPQEAAVAAMAAAGQTNAEIGAALFISGNTVDYHLRKVFRKLAITSRRQLAERLPRDHL